MFSTLPVGKIVEQNNAVAAVEQPLRQV